jgi:LuxR family transcriptional regulator, maltose regulon positive regulatory protein
MHVRVEAATAPERGPSRSAAVPSARVPRLPQGPLVRRARLGDRLARAVASAELTLVCAPAGFGKTVLTAQWAADRPDAAWLTLEPADARPAVFWSHLTSALGSRATAHPGAAIRPEDVDALADELATREREPTLVLDRFERATDRACQAVERLLDRSDGRLRLVLLTRRRPALPLYRYRLERPLAELGTDDLRFTAKAAGAAFAVLGLAPSGAAVRAVLDACDGWPAAVRFTALELQRRRWTTPSVEQALACLRAGDGSLDEFLTAEVVAGLSPSDRDLLRATSVVDDFSPALAAWLAGDRQAERARVLAQTDPLVTGGASGRRPRVNPLLRATLYAALCREHPQEAARLHRRTAEFFVAHGSPGQAAAHATLAGDAAYGADVLVEAGVVARCLLAPADADGLDGWVPGSSVETRQTAVVQAARAALAGDVDRARVWLATAHGFGAGTGASALSTTLVHLRICLREGDAEGALDAVGWARSQVAALPPSAGRVVSAGLQEVEGRISFHEGELDTAAGRLADAVDRLAGDESGPRRSGPLAMLAMVEACRGNLTRAQALAESEERTGDDAGARPDGWSAASALARAWVATERQELSRAQLWLARADRALDAQDDRTLRAVALLLRGRLLRDRGNLAGARQLLERRGPESSWLAAPLEQEEQALRAGADRDGPEEPANGTARARGSATGATTVGLPDLRVQAVPVQVERMVDRAERLCRHGQPADGRALVLEALSLGEPEQLRRPFRHAGPGVRALLRTDPELVGRSAWLARATGAPSRPATPAHRSGHRVAAPRPAAARAPARHGPGEPLTEREREILDRLAEPMSTQEIAASMFISVNTVRTHIRHILDKLSVGRRNEAVRLARELGLV